MDYMLSLCHTEEFTNLFKKLCRGIFSRFSDTVYCYAKYSFEEYEEKLFWNRPYIPDGEALSEKRNLIIGLITKENVNFGIMRDGKQAAIANGNGMSNTNKLELKQKLNCQKLSMNILKQNNLSRYFI